MRTLSSPSSRVAAEKKWVGGENVFLHKLEPCFLMPKRSSENFRFLNLVCFLKQSKPIRPVICLSSKTQTELEVADSQMQEAYHTKTIHVKFQLQKECSFGQDFLIVGDDPMFGLWDPASAIPMNWSDGNVWTVEMDIPVGKSIQFKFILKESTGNISWQPGPDRIFQTWETKNAITVCEDWADAELQKIIEEDHVSDEGDGSNVNADMLIVDENLTQPNDELAFNITNEPTITSSNTDPAEKPLVEPWKEQIGARNGSPSQENVTPKWPNAYVEPYEEQFAARAAVLNEERVIFPSEDCAAISSKELLVADNIFGNNGGAATVMNLSSTQIEGSLINYEEGPVLVPGLTPSPAVPTEEVNKEGIDKQMSFDGSVGAFEAKDRNMPELEEKQEQYSDLPQEVTNVMINANEGNFDDEIKQTPHPANKEEQFHSEPVNDKVLCSDQPQVETAAAINDNEENSAKKEEQSDSEPINEVFQNDMQWGRKMLQNLLSNFRLL
ncbi:hypothetical protein ACFX12_032916 [Malus domestica]